MSWYVMILQKLEGSEESLEAVGLRCVCSSSMAFASSVGDGQILYDIIRKHSLFRPGFGRNNWRSKSKSEPFWGSHAAFQRGRKWAQGTSRWWLFGHSHHLRQRGHGRTAHQWTPQGAISSQVAWAFGRHFFVANFGQPMTMGFPLSTHHCWKKNTGRRTWTFWVAGVPALRNFVSRIWLGSAIGCHENAGWMSINI